MSDALLYHREKMKIMTDYHSKNEENYKEIIGTETHLDVKKYIKTYYSDNITIEGRSLDEDTSGYIELLKNGKYKIVYNSNHHPNRSKFTIAHEFGHYILHQDILGDGTSDNKLYRTTDQLIHYNYKMSSLREFEANVFAARLLLPRFLIEKVMRDLMSDNKSCITQISHIVSYLAIDSTRMSGEVLDEDTLNIISKKAQVSPWLMKLRLRHDDLDDIRDKKLIIDS